MFKDKFSISLFRFLFLVFIFTISYVYMVKDCFAARSITILGDKDSLFGDEQLTIDGQLSGFTEGETIYVKGAFYQDGTSNYFGYTKNGESWIKNGAATTTQRQVKIGEWDGKIQAKSDFSDSGFKGEGSYKLKIGFYYTTTGGNLSSVNWSSNALDVNISEPDPTPSPVSSPVVASSPSPNAGKISSPSPKVTPSVLPKLAGLSAKPSPEVLGVKSQESDFNQKLEPSSSPSPTVQPEKSISRAKTAGILVGSGLIIIACATGFFFWYKKVMGSAQNPEKEDAETSSY